MLVLLRVLSTSSWSLMSNELDNLKMYLKAVCKRRHCLHISLLAPDKTSRSRSKIVTLWPFWDKPVTVASNPIDKEPFTHGPCRWINFAKTGSTQHNPKSTQYNISTIHHGLLLWPWTQKTLHSYFEKCLWQTVFVAALHSHIREEITKKWGDFQGGSSWDIYQTVDKLI